jgi:hypothetical protein
MLLDAMCQGYLSRQSPRELYRLTLKKKRVASWAPMAHATETLATQETDRGDCARPSLVKTHHTKKGLVEWLKV